MWAPDFDEVVELRYQDFGQAMTDFSQQIASLPIQFSVGIQFFIPTVSFISLVRSQGGASQRKARDKEKLVKKLWIGVCKAILMPAVLGKKPIGRLYGGCPDHLFFAQTARIPHLLPWQREFGCYDVDS
jgi:hypothetical protein